MAIGQLVTCRWARIMARGGLLTSPAARLPRYVMISDSERVPLDTDEIADWPVPGSVLFPSPLMRPLEAEWTVLGEDAHALWISTPPVTWTGEMVPLLPYAIRALAYYTAVASPGAILMGVVRLPAPVVLSSPTDEYTAVPTWPVRSAVREG